MMNPKYQYQMPTQVTAHTSSGTFVFQVSGGTFGAAAPTRVNIMSSTELAPQCIEGIAELFIMRDKRTGLYVGYDGYDTDFSKGISAFISQAELFDRLNKELIYHTLEEMEILLRCPEDKVWVKYGGYDNLDIIRVDLLLQAEAFSPSDISQILLLERLESEVNDSEAQMELNLNHDENP